MAAGRHGPITLSGVKVSAEIHFRLCRIVTKSNEVRVGAGMLRYAKNRPLNPKAAAWQSAFLLGYLCITGVDPSETPEAKLCIPVDAFSGVDYPAPGSAANRFKNMKAACESIAERWDNIQPPRGAVL